MTLEPPRGAVYVPSRAFNSYQAWRDYSPSDTARNFSYARRLNLNALRLWASHESWRENPSDFQAAFDDMLAAAASNNLKIMPSLFEGCGKDGIPENFRDLDPATAACTTSPSFAVVDDKSRWKEPLEFLEWFMHTYKNDNRLLAIEIFNEPGMMRDRHDAAFDLARTLFQHAAKSRGAVPLTVGNNELLESLFYLEHGLDILQYHNNFPPTAAAFEENLAKAQYVQRTLQKPVWITEWQRIRIGQPGWDGAKVRDDERGPAYHTLTPSFEKFPLGRFFWSLMLKPAYLPRQRKAGTFNGLFHEDGSVYSLTDARALSANPNFQAEERPAFQFKG